MKGIVQVHVTLTAGWGDGSESSMNGLASEEELKTLETLAKKFPELLDVSDTAGPISVDIVDYTRLWLCGGDNDLLEKLYDLNIDEFSAAIRKNLAPIGYQE